MRKAFLLKGLPECAVDTQMHSLSPATIKQYNVTFQAWWSYCNQHKIHPFQADTSEVIKFLQFQLDSKSCKYGTFNSHRSALSLILQGEIANDPRMKRFLKAISKIRPQRPKYNITWDPQIVLDYLKSQAPNDKLSLLDLSKKVATLLALVTGHRIQTLFLIRVSDIWFVEKGAKIYISESIKSSGVNRVQPCLDIPFFTQDIRLCPASALLTYVERSAEIRPEDQNYLFITSREPFVRASKDTIGRWISHTLKAAGLDTNIFTPHSTRHASTSNAFRKGVSLDLIRKTAGWSSKSETFAKFYHRPINDSNFAESILRRT